MCRNNVAWYKFAFAVWRKRKLRVVPHFSSGIVERANASLRENYPTREKATRGGETFSRLGFDFHARSRFARSTIPEEKWGTTRSLT